MLQLYFLSAVVTYSKISSILYCVQTPKGGYCVNKRREIDQICEFWGVEW